MPGKFQVIGTLPDGTDVVLYNQTAYEFKSLGGYHGAYRLNFAPTTVKAITLKCIAPYTGYTGGKAMPDANVAYWLSEICLYNDVDRTSPVNVSTSDNLAFRAVPTSNISNLNKDRPVTDISNGMGPNPFFGGYLILGSQANLSLGSPLVLSFQYPSLTTLNNIKVYGRDASANDGIIGKYRIKGYSASGEETILYDTENAASYPGVSVTPAGANQPLSISFPRVTVASVAIETWEATPCGDGNVMYWLTEIEMYNVGGAKTISTDKQSLALDLSAAPSATIAATLDPASGQTLVWSSSDSAVATVSGGVVTAQSEGNCVITVSLADDPTVKKTVPVTVVEGVVPVESVSLNKSSISVVVNASDNTLAATVNPENATVKTVTWSSDDTGIATVDENGVVRGVAPGTTTIRVKSTDDPSKEATCAVEVTKIAVAGVSVEPSAVTLDSRQTATLTATVSPADATYKGIRWESENESIAAVDAQTGVVTAVGSGASCKIYAVSTDDETIKGYCTVTVNSIPVSGLYLYADEAFENELTEMSIAAGQTKPVYPYIDPTDATNLQIQWSSSNTAVATVDGNGNVTGVGAGEATITATSADNTEISAQFTVKVTGTGTPDTSDSFSFLYVMAVIASLSLASYDLMRRKDIKTR